MIERVQLHIKMSRVLLFVAIMALSTVGECGLFGTLLHTTKSRSEETDGLFEGDIILDNGLDGQKENQVNKIIQMASVIHGATYKWPNRKIPYEISNSFNFVQKFFIEKAIRQFNDDTCLEFVERTDQSDYVRIVREGGCSSSVGRQGSQQTLKLDNSCSYDKGVIMHEMMHAVGFWHEHSRPDRDDYIIINYENIQKGKEWNFKKHENSEVFGTPYDYKSLMHYPEISFAKSVRFLPFLRKKTIEPKKSGVNIGQRVGLSDIDKREIKELYDC